MDWYDVYADDVLRRLVNVLVTLTYVFIYLANATEGKFIVGTYVTPFAIDCAQWLADSAQSVEEFRRRYHGVSDFIRDSLSGNLILDRLYELWEEFYELRTSPIYWIVGHLERAIPGFSRFASNPLRWLRDQMEDISPDLANLISNPVSWFYYKLVGLSRDLELAAFDRWQYVIGQIEIVWPDLAEFSRDPRWFLQHHLAQWSGLPVWAFDDPVGYARQRVIQERDEALYNSKEWIKDAGEHLLRWIVEGEW